MQQFITYYCLNMEDNFIIITFPIVEIVEIDDRLEINTFLLVFANFCCTDTIISNEFCLKPSVSVNL